VDKIFVSKEEASNKFWGYTRNDNDMTVTAHWGRLGLEGQQKVHPFHGTYDVDNFIFSKTREKLRGGYSEVTPEQYEVEVAMAKTVGVGQKVDQLLFVEDRGSTLTPLDATKLHNPDLKPYVYAKLIGILKDGVRPVKEFIFTPTESFTVRTNSSFQIITKTKIDGGEDAKMAAAVEEVVGRVLF
jgi:predicted DNA-binding WGR domain protein